MVRIDSIKCTGCGYCVDVCPQQAITIDNDVAVVNQELCVQCGTCLEICPANAIHVIAPIYAESGKGGDIMIGRGWFGGGRGRGWGGFGFRGASPPWPYVGRGRGGLPRCWHPGLWGGAASYWPRPAHEEELGFLKDQAGVMKHQLGDIERRIQELEKKE